MRTVTRLLLFAAIVAIITVTIAPPVRTTADAGAPVDVQAPSAPADVTGTYAGTITSDTPDEMPDGGTIIIRREGEALVVTAGPDAETQYTSEQVVRTSEGLTFQVTLPGDGPTRVLHFDLKIEGAQMTGTFALLRDGTRLNGRLTFTKQ